MEADHRGLAVPAESPQRLKFGSKSIAWIRTVQRRPLTIALFLCLTLMFFLVGLRVARQVKEKGEVSPPRAEGTSRLQDWSRGQAGGQRTAEDVPGDSLLAKVKGFARKLKSPFARRNEAVVRFRSESAYRDFLRNAGARGLEVLGQLDRFRAVRVGFEDVESLRNGLRDTAAADLALDANFLVTVPTPPAESVPTSGAALKSFEGGALEWLGVRTDNSFWGAGIKVAVLDTGVQEHTAFADGQVESIDLVGGESAQQSDIQGHGTAVASIIGSNLEALGGVAPAAELVSFQVISGDGVGDSFTLADGIVQAVDTGAQVVNISLGSFGDSLLVREAIAYALENNVAVVAAAGNDGGTQISYPAAYDGVVAVGAVDANSQHVPFSNRSEDLSLVAPGYGVYAAWPGGQAVSFSGTSASAPFVSASVAAVLSENPDLSPSQAVDLLVEHSNEGGPPGDDSQFGAGILNIGRVMDRNEKGIHDLAVASHFLPIGESAAATGSDLLVTLENRGTEHLYNIVLRVEGTAGSEVYTVPSMEPGETSSHEVPTGLGGRQDGEGYTFRSSVSFVGPEDRNLSDNRLETSFVFE